MSQKYRSASVKALRDGEAEILVATDIAGRGLDLPTVTHVVNFELPNVIDEFVHRCGRTGRIGRKGTAVTFVTGREKIFLALRRTLLELGMQLPEWLSLQGMDLAWRPRYYKLPFTKVREAPDNNARSQERMEYMERLRSRERRQKTALMEKAAACERGEADMGQDARRSSEGGYGQPAPALVP